MTPAYRQRWTAQVTSMRIQGEIDAETYARLKP